MNNQNDILVSICCITYNQAPYIRQCLDGFLMQKTNFNVEILIHDDCSTDGTTSIVREYAAKYPDLIVPLIQDTNQYQNGNKKILATFVFPKAKGKYFALCEGDDFWIDPLKLQKQVDYLECHPECTMTCNRALLFSDLRKKYIGEQYCKNREGYLSAEDVINRTGLYIPTCSIVFRSCIYNSYPEYCKNCGIGDYPLQIFAAMKGYIYYDDRAKSVYRIDNSNSWTGSQHFHSVSSKRLHDVWAQKEMFKGFSNDYPQYIEVYDNKIAEHIIRNMPLWNASAEEKEKYLDYFSRDIEKFSLFWKITLFFHKLRFPFVRKLYVLTFLRKYKHLQKIYLAYRIKRFIKRHQCLQIKR